VVEQNSYRKEFHHWALLADCDPQAFENLRRELIEQFIQEAPEERRQKLRCLQWRIDQERRLSKSPLGACIRLTRMMWDKVMAQGGLLDNLQQLSKDLEGNAHTERSATLLPFPRRND
jgi:hypothetical protein